MVSINRETNNCVYSLVLSLPLLVLTTLPWRSMARYMLVDFK